MHGATIKTRNMCLFMALSYDISPSDYVVSIDKMNSSK